MQDKTQKFIIRSFKKYYSAEKLEVPDRLSRREFGLMFFDRSFVLRHISFATKQELRGYIIDNVPSHLYYSSAYYEKPDAQNMADKKWMGADLVFDLDADHVRDVAGLSYPDMLKRVKDEMIRLIDEFIIGDLGVDEKHLKIVFSGGRGYHAHVNDPRVLKLESHERREIVDYITGTDLDFDWLFPSVTFDAKQFAQRVHPITKKEMPKKDSGGWKGKMVRGLPKFLQDLETMGVDEAVRRFSGLRDERSKRALGEKTVREMYSELFKKRKGSGRGTDRIIAENNIEIFSRESHLTAFLRILNNYVKIALVGETDEPVTSDIRRLIRLPSSLHGKTGLRVTSLSRDLLPDFDPLRDAFPSSLTDKTMKIEVKENIRIKLKDEEFVFETGESEVPEFAALFLACRKSAELI